MKMHIFNRYAVHLRLGFADDVKDPLGQALHLGLERGGIDHTANLRETPMMNPHLSFAIAICMLVRVAVIMGMAVIVFVAVLVAMGLGELLRAGGFVGVWIMHRHFPAADTALHHVGECHCDPVESKQGGQGDDLVFNTGEARAGGDKHIAGNAGVGFDFEDRRHR